MALSVEFRHSALKELNDLPQYMHKRILLTINMLADNPRPFGCKKLKGCSDTWRIRVGDYRIVYEINDNILVVFIVKIAHRREVYRDL